MSEVDPGVSKNDSPVTELKVLGPNTVHGPDKGPQEAFGLVALQMQGTLWSPNHLKRSHYLGVLRKSPLSVN